MEVLVIKERFLVVVRRRIAFQHCDDVTVTWRHRQTIRTKWVVTGGGIAHLWRQEFSFWRQLRPAGRWDYCSRIHWSVAVKNKSAKQSVHRPGIEPGSPAWQASILPLDHRCFTLSWRSLTELSIKSGSYTCASWTYGTSRPSEATWGLTVFKEHHWSFTCYSELVRKKVTFVSRILHVHYDDTYHVWISYYGQRRWCKG